MRAERASKDARQRHLFRVHFALAGKVELFAAAPDEARRKARDRFPAAETGPITKVKRVKENADV